MANCEVVEAENGQEAITILKDTAFDIILMDIQMPIMDGIEATIIIRNELKLSIPIIALTANAFKTEIEKCKSIGMNDHITKPFEENILLETISKYINKTASTPQDIKLQLSYNLENLNSLSRGNEEFVKKMIQIFIKQTSDIIVDTEKAIEENNFEEVSRLIHKIKPSIDGMGIDSIKKEVRDLELYSKTSNDKEKINEMFSIIKTVLLKVVDEINSNEINK
jgi:CheY-like chemotaxis protein/HPt (histidine-containing phosphotransfer) domain-containing protein